MLAHASGNYLTPFSINGQSFTGAIYDRTLRIVPGSLRECINTSIRHQDPYYLLHSSTYNLNVVDEDIIYLGHYFSLYGHFLLESLPMLNELIMNDSQTALFLPWWGFNGRNLLDHFLDFLNIARNRVVIYNEPKMLKASFKVASRPIALNYALYSREPYQNVISRLKQNLVLSPSSKNEGGKYFLIRRSNRVSPQRSHIIQATFEKHGYTSIRPEILSLDEQLKIFFGASEIAGISGSQMHNSIFCSESCAVFIVGDSRDSEQLQSNQRICTEISQTKTTFIPYVDDDIKASRLIEEVVSSGSF